MPIEDSFKTVFAALYLEGAPGRARLPASRWPEVAWALAEKKPSADPARTLRNAGLSEEAFAIGHAELRHWAEGVVERKLCLTVADEGYPWHWVLRLGEAAPPALWRSGAMPFGTPLTLVGSRDAPESSLTAAFQLGHKIASLRGITVSGGARGCDREAAQGAIAGGGSVVEIWPRGLAMMACPGEDAPPTTVLSLCAPEEPFSIRRAKQRNALLYAFSPYSVVVHAQFGEGGTWQGARHAMRRNLTQVLAYTGGEPDTDPGLRALIQDGAWPLRNLEELAPLLPPERPLAPLFRDRLRDAFLARSGGQAALFEFSL